ncbi:hypothetical protein [Noviherbaspirillum soli]|uniref:hypothetical protein n=1 Tax=Noviherbaspirillum soli TaxID=1064518 RepID=UPI00188DB509|nr:hypothetical protein [Noviherbaspirillum soli]
MKKVSGSNFYQINSASLEKIKIAATGAGTANATRNPFDSARRVDHQILKPGEAELWQIKEFLQHEQGIATNAFGILHAEEIKEKGHDGSISKKIRLYVRSSPDGRDDGFFAKFKYENQQRRAAEVLASLAKAYQSAATSPQAGHPKDDALQRLITQSASLDIETIASCIQDVAFGIEAEKLKQSTAATEEHNRMREHLKGKLPGRANDEGRINANEAAQNLKEFGFKAAEVRAFHKLVNNIMDGKGRTDDEDEYAIRKFQDHWLRGCERRTDTGKSFRALICSNPEYQRWNTIVHCLARCAKSKFDFDAYYHKDYIMLPSIKDMDWSKARRDEGITYDLMKIMHEEAGKNNTFECENSARSGQKLFAAKRCRISPQQNTLELQQKAYLARMYKSITDGHVESGSAWVLTPLFNYTENTIDQCIAIMLRPFKSAFEAGKTSLEVDIFSADHRITDKFDKAWEKLRASNKMEFSLS